MDSLTPLELKARLLRNDRPLLLDVRQDWETRLCRLENSVHIPIEEIELRTDELNPEDEIVIYCHQGRSEEHTSELQSLAYLVCRLLLEKKKEQEHSHLACLFTIPFCY